MLAYFSLFCSGLLAATLFPASSEILLLALLQQGYNSLWLFVAATAGNTLGSCINWYLGLKLLKFQHKRWFPVSEAALGRAQQQFQRFGSWSLLFAWLPVVGDPLTLVAGVLKVRFKVFMLLVLVGKAARYAILIWFGNLWLV
ncbi:membrane protein YqaA with SNARE-associated domain [Rheinheimera pacifica]|uniref:YqaA family protein n=1 Tax=Rheinheimera pacifica TaxID=173990 RepID=UPI00286E15AA|nr:YqaA family protein [Rheinheimera pacifica]MCS4308792.1 membrane protein YqaA with SNARE-associated domain [Rheinheimera pacifica]